MRFHVVALPHTQTAMSHSACAFTMKILHFCQMMSSLGHEVYHYGVEGSEVQDCCIEDVTILSKAEQEGFSAVRSQRPLRSRLERPGTLLAVDQ